LRLQGSGFGPALFAACDVDLLAPGPRKGFNINLTDD